MTSFFMKTAVLFVVLFAGLDAAAADPPPEDGQGVQIPQVEPDAPDFSAVSRAVLERMAADLALQNLLLARGAAAQTPEAPTVEDNAEHLDAAIAGLELRLQALRQRRAALRPAGGADDAGTEIRAAAEGSVPYRYRYSFGLIGTSGRGRLIIRGENGRLRGESFNFSEFRDDAVWVKLLFRNDGDTAQRFTGAVALGQRTSGLSGERVRVLATVGLSTPLLQPGEIYTTDQEVRVERVRDVDFVEVGRVRSFPAGQ